MPKIVDDTPEGLRPYLYHGVELVWKETSKQAEGQCPFCGVDKFSVEIETTKYRCFRCGESGNNYEFIRWIWDQSYGATMEYEGLATV